jgi:hypothetical protein
MPINPRQLDRGVRPNLANESPLEARFFPEASSSGPYLLIADWNTQPSRWDLSKLTVLHVRIGTGPTD